MKYILLMHHDEQAFSKFSETERQQMLEESVQLTHQLHARGSIWTQRRCTRRQRRSAFEFATVRGW